MESVASDNCRGRIQQRSGQGGCNLRTCDTVITYKGLHDDNKHQGVSTTEAKADLIRDMSTMNSISNIDEVFLPQAWVSIKHLAKLRVAGGGR